MSFGLGHGKSLSAGEIGLTMDDLAPMPDAALGPAGDPSLAWIDPRGWFEDASASFELEIGSGKGTFILEQAQRQPETNFLGIEWAREFYLYAADRIRRRGLTNVRMLHADATEILRWRMPPGIIDVIHLYFSDPWPKKKHQKRRVVQDAFLANAHRALKAGGELRIVTDHPEYWVWMEAHFDRWSSAEGVDGLRFDREAFTSEKRAHGAGEGELVGTNFERKYAREGRPFNAAALRKPA